jgi:hypothetical protein
VPRPSTPARRASSATAGAVCLAARARCAVRPAAARPVRSPPTVCRSGTARCPPQWRLARGMGSGIGIGRAACNALGRRLAFDEFKHQGACGLSACVGDRDPRRHRSHQCWDDSGPQDPSFALEACQALRIARERRRQYLDGDIAAKLRIPVAVHPAHAAGTQPPTPLRRGRSVGQRVWRFQALSSPDGFLRPLNDLLKEDGRHA